MHGYSKGVELRLTQIKQHFEGKFDIEKFIKIQKRAMETGNRHSHADHIDETGKYAEKFEQEQGILP
jgi:hypothetical protein